MDVLAPEVVLAILGVGLTVYSLLPQERRLRLHLRMHRLDWLLVILALLAVHYILFFPVLHRVGWAFDLGEWRWGFTPALASYSVILGVGLLVGWRTSRARLSRSRIPILRRLLEELQYERRFGELFFLLEEHLRPLERAYQNDFLLSRIRREVLPSFGKHHLAALQGTTVREWPAALQKLAKSLPTYESVEMEARHVVRRLLLAEPAVAAMAQTRPYLGLKILETDFREIEEFQELWFAALLNDPHSVLHHELRENQNTTGSHRYVIDPKNRILNFYFADVSVAQDRAVYRAFGGFAMTDLGSRRGNPNDRYNRPLADFAEGDCWKSGFHSAFRLFDIMIPEALCQGIKWHMWLYYLPSLVDGILENLNPTPEVDLTSEWPTPYHYFLYEIVSMLRWWVTLVEDVPEGQENAALDGINTSHANGNIPKSSALALGMIMTKVLVSDRLTDRFKRYLFDIPLRQARTLIENQERPEYGELLVLCLAKGAFLGGHDTAYRAQVQRVWEEMDHLLRFELREYWDRHF